MKRLELQALSQRTRGRSTHNDNSIIRHDAHYKMRSNYSQLVRLLRRLELPPEVRTLYFGGVRELEQAVAKCGLVENQHFERINES